MEKYIELSNLKEGMEENMSYSGLSTRISSYLAQELKYCEEEKEILAYAVENILMTVLGFAIIMFIGLLLRAPYETFFAAVAAGTLRKFSGGAHFSTPAKCLLTGGLVYPLFGLIVKNVLMDYVKEPMFLTVVLITAVVSFYIVFKYAPVDSVNKPIVSPEFRKKLFRASIVTILVFYAVAFLNYYTSLGLSILGGIFLQAVTLLPLLNRRRR